MWPGMLGLAERREVTFGRSSGCELQEVDVINRALLNLIRPVIKLAWIDAIYDFPPLDEASRLGLEEIARQRQSRLSRALHRDYKYGVVLNDMESQFQLLVSLTPYTISATGLTESPRAIIYEAEDGGDLVVAKLTEIELDALHNAVPTSLARHIRVDSPS
jgi:hypothetical protein